MENVGVEHEGALAAGPEPGRAAARAPRVVIADDDADMRDALEDLLARDGCLVTALPNGTELVRYLARCAEDDLLPDVVIVDHLMPGYSGLQICEWLWELDWPLPIVLVTAFGAVVGPLARTFGATIVDKAWPADDVRSAVYGALALASLERPGLRCASCGATRQVRLHPTLEVPMCAGCLERAGPPDDDDELGVVD